MMVVMAMPQMMAPCTRNSLCQSVSSLQHSTLPHHLDTMQLSPLHLLDISVQGILHTPCHDCALTAAGGCSCNSRQ